VSNGGYRTKATIREDIKMQQNTSWNTGDKSTGVEKAGAIQAVTLLKDLHFPADKTQIVEYAKSHDASSAVMMFLNRLPDKEYSTSADIGKETT
jgi:hypothetical protein